MSEQKNPHPDLAALIANELEVRHGTTQTWGTHIAGRVAEWLTSPETLNRVASEVGDWSATAERAIRAAVWETE